MLEVGWNPKQPFLKHPGLLNMESFQWVSEESLWETTNESGLFESTSDVNHHDRAMGQHQWGTFWGQRISCGGSESYNIQHHIKPVQYIFTLGKTSQCFIERYKTLLGFA